MDKKSIIWICLAVVAVIAIIGLFTPQVKQVLGFAGSKTGISDLCQGEGPNYLCFGKTAGSMLINGSSTPNTGSWKNPYKQVVWVRPYVFVSGTASTTFFFEAGTSTASTVSGTSWIANPRVVPTIEIGTGTPFFVWSPASSAGATTSQFQAALSTNPLGTATATPLNNVKAYLDGGATRAINSLQWTPVRSDEYVQFLLRPTFTDCDANVGRRVETGNSHQGCEAATSTNRGFDVYWGLEYMFVASSTVN